MANTVTLKLLADTKGIRDGINQTNKQLTGLQGGLSKTTSFVKGMVGGFLALQGVQAATRFLGDAVKAASDLSETVNKSNTIFGEQAGAINKWASSAATSVGLSKAAALEAASGFGNMFSQLGFAGEEAASMSTKVVQMSADLGSFNNLPTADVADKMSAAFRGEYDSLQSLIPNINAARVEQEAMAATGKENAKELTAQEKAAAVLAIVQKDGSAAMGDFARTSDGLANKQKILQAKFEDVKAVVGNALLPIMSSLASVILDKVVPGAQTLATWFGDNVVPKLKELWSTLRTNVLPVLQSVGTFITGTVVPALQSMGGFISRNSTLFGALAVGLGTLYAAFVIYNTAMRTWAALTKAYAAVQAFFNAIMMINPFILILAGLVALVAALVYAWKNSETFRNIVTGVWNAIKGAVMSVLNWFKGTLWPGIVNVYNNIKNGVKTVLSIYISVWAAIIRAVASVPGKIIGFFRSLPGAISNIWNSIKSGAVNGFNALVSFVRGVPRNILNALGSVGSLLSSAGKSIIDGLLGGIKSGFTKVKDTLGNLTSMLPDWKGPAVVDKKLLINNGQLVISGFIKGLESQYGRVQSSLGGLTGNISSTNFGTPAMAVAGAGGGNVYVTVNAPVGSSPEDIGRELDRNLKAWYRVNGR